jgi:hypothetical protein
VLPLLRMGLRLGGTPRLLLTTTPKPIAALRRLLAEPGCAVSRAPTAANAGALAPAFLDGWRRCTAGRGWRGRSWRACWWRAKAPVAGGGAAAVSRGRAGDGVRAGGGGGGSAGDGGRGPVRDRGGGAAGRAGLRAGGRHGGGCRRWAGPGGPRTARGAGGRRRSWPRGTRAGRWCGARWRWPGAPCPVELAWAGRSKRARAEPVARSMSRGGVSHCGAFGAPGGGADGAGERGGARVADSPDRADALVWALTELMLGPAAVEPRIRRL